MKFDTKNTWLVDTNSNDVVSNSQMPMSPKLHGWLTDGVQCFLREHTIAQYCNTPSQLALEMTENLFFVLYKKILWQCLGGNVGSLKFGCDWINFNFFAMYMLTEMMVTYVYVFGTWS